MLKFPHSNIFVICLSQYYAYRASFSTIFTFCWFVLLFCLPVHVTRPLDSISTSTLISSSSLACAFVVCSQRKRSEDVVLCRSGTSQSKEEAQWSKLEWNESSVSIFYSTKHSDLSLTRNPCGANAIPPHPWK